MFDDKFAVMDTLLNGKESFSREVQLKPPYMIRSVLRPYDSFTCPTYTYNFVIFSEHKFSIFCLFIAPYTQVSLAEISFSLLEGMF